MRAILTALITTLALTSTGLISRVVAQCPNYSDGVAEAGIGSVTGGTYVPMVYIDCLTSIQSIEVQFGRPGLTVPINGDPLTLAVWDDPTDDMNPNDAVLIATIPIPAGITGGHTGQWQRYDLTALLGNAILATGGMFIGAAVSYPASSGQGPSSIDFTNFTVGTQWMGGRYPSNPGPFNFASVTSNSFLTPVQNQGFPPGNWLLRASGFERFPHSCGAAGITCIGSGLIGTNVVTTLQNAQGFPFVGYGLVQLGIPFCNCTVAHEFSFLVGGASHTLSIPPLPSNIGLQILIQGLDFLAPGGCPNPQYTLTDSFSFLIH
ncbi:MAG: hypothetical protein ABIP94_14315 [Planctomycetota bacterium]